MIHLDLHVIVIRNSADSVFLSLQRKLFQSLMSKLCNIQIKQIFIWSKTTLRSLLNSQACLTSFNASLLKTTNSAVTMRLTVRNTDLLKMTLFPLLIEEENSNQLMSNTFTTTCISATLSWETDPISSTRIFFLQATLKRYSKSSITIILNESLNKLKMEL